MKSNSSLIALATLFVTTTASAQFTQERKIATNEPTITKQEMHLTVIDAESKEFTPTDVMVKGLNSRRTTTFASVRDTTFEIRNYRLYTVSCIKAGYMYYNKKFWPEATHVHEQNISLRPIQAGLKTDIRDITFLGNKTEIYHKSKESLSELIEWMNLNPSVKVAIIGHVNGPDDSRSERFYQKASEDRAGAVVQYLIEHGIAEERLVAKGGGNKEMIYANPQTDWESQANRRIEVEILEF